jgi:hypothetical protein
MAGTLAELRLAEVNTSHGAIVEYIRELEQMLENQSDARSLGQAILF